MRNETEVITKFRISLARIPSDLGVCTNFLRSLSVLHLLAAGSSEEELGAWDFGEEESSTPIGTGLSRGRGAAAAQWVVARQTVRGILHDLI